MALAGYLVLNNVRAAFVEIHTGVLVCTPQLRKTRLPPAPASSQLFQPPPVSCCNNSIANDNNNNNNVADDCMDPLRLSTSSTDSTATNMSCSDAGSDDLPTGNTNNHINEQFALPLLARRCMLTKHSSVVCRHKPMRGGSDCNRYTMNTITHDNNNDNDDNDNSEPAMSHCGRARVVQLSGLVVEVLDAEHELDTPLSYPFSFQVNTYTPSKRDADNNIVAGSSERVESLVLSAVDARAKALWVKRIRLWNRYGWRDTEFVHADDSDYFTLQARLLTDAPHQSYSAALSQRTPVYDSVNTNQRDNDSCSIVASSTHRPTRRRFYRAPLPTSGLGLLVPP